MEGIKFRTYQNPAVSAALTANSLRPTKSTFLTIFSLSTLSAFLLLTIFSRQDGFINNLRLIKHVSQSAAYLVAKIIQVIVGLVFVGTVIAFVRAFLLKRASGNKKEQKHLSERQLGLVGIKLKAVENLESEKYESPAKKPPKSRMSYSGGWSSPSTALFPLHRNNNGTSTNSPYSTVSGSNNKMSSRYTPSSSKSPGSSSSSLYLVSSPSLQGSLVKTSPGLERNVSSPWSKQCTPPRKDITNEEMLEQFLVDVDEKISELAEKQTTTTPPPAVGGFGIASPSTVVNSANTSGTTRSTPLRPVRMSPSSQKFSTPPKKGEGDLPPPMSMEEAIEAFENLGIYPEIEEWRDRLRQWFSSVLLNPLINKIETTHIQVNHAAARLGYAITISQVGSDSTSSTVPSTVSPIDGTKEWQPAFAMDEDGHLYQLRAKLVQALDAPATNLPSTNLLQPEQQNLLQECVDAITEHQRLHALMKGEWVKGLLPQSSVRADYTVQRIRELAEGTCLKNYEYMGSGEVYDKVNKKWTLELPTDSHLLLYLFCAFLEHPKWMLHVDPTLYASAQSSKNPLFLGVLPPKERFPEKYVAVISGVPPVLHPGACIVVVGKQSPPLFALYWDKKLQFSLQGRTALWDAILLLCHRIKLDYGGVVRGMHLSSAAFNILPVIESEAEN